jgi:hypothetical protein
MAAIPAAARIDDFIHGNSGVSHQRDQRKQKLPAGLRERLKGLQPWLRIAAHDTVHFLRGGSVLSNGLKLANRF